MQRSLHFSSLSRKLISNKGECRKMLYSHKPLFRRFGHQQTVSFSATIKEQQRAPLSQRIQCQTTDAVLMVCPWEFEFNEQTAIDNEFQHKTAGNVKEKALKEFGDSVEILRQKGIHVMVLYPADVPTATAKTPDAVFPNNWISTNHDGTIVVFPMATPNRRAEVNRLPEVKEMLKTNGFDVTNVHILDEENGKYLEGTGSMVIDHVNRVIYAAISERTCLEQVQKFAKLRNFKRVIAFDTLSSTGKHFYHTNVMMSVGVDVAVLCSESITNEDQRKLVIDELKSTQHEIIDISLEQAEKYFCGNVLQLRNSNNELYMAMSQSAYSAFTNEQKMKLEKHGKLIPLPVDTIEHVGGGSARCMICEIFLPKKQ